MTLHYVEDTTWFMPHSEEIDLARLWIHQSQIV